MTETKSFTQIITKTAFRYRTEFNQTLSSNGFNDITPDYFIVLECLWEEDNISIGQLAKRTSKDNASLTRILDGMERNDLVNRIPSPSDKRSFFITLTSYSRNFKEKLIKIEASVLEKATKGLNPIEVKELIRMLKHIHGTLA